MTEQLHDDEADTSEASVRSLLEAQTPQWAELPLDYLRTSGTDNAMWRLKRREEPDLVVRLPRIPGAAKGVAKELALLPLLGPASLGPSVATPTVCHAGHPTDDYPYPWAVLGWLDGTDAWTARRTLDPSSDELATDLAALVSALGALNGLPVPSRREGDRGGPLGPLLERLDRWLTDAKWSASQYLDIAAVRRVAAECSEVVGGPVASRFVHGDLIPGNLLVTTGRLSAVIDWGGAGYGDPAQDLAPAWSVLDRRGRNIFREDLGVDDESWLRSRAFELEHAVGGIVYYTPRGHPLADVMARTLHRLLTGA